MNKHLLNYYYNYWIDKGFAGNLQCYRHIVFSYFTEVLYSGFYKILIKKLVCLIIIIIIIIIIM